MKATTIFYLRISIAANIALLSALAFKYRPINNSKNDSKNIISKISFVGDSRFSQADWSTGLQRNDVKNNAISGCTTESLLIKLDSAVKWKPALCFIQVGVNDIRKQKNIDSIILAYGKMVIYLKKNNIDPVVTSVIPVVRDFTQDEVNEFKLNDNISKLNDSLVSMAKKYNVDFLDINKSIIDGTRLNRLFTSDGIHLNPKGYEKIFIEINNYLKIKNR